MNSSRPTTPWHSHPPQKLPLNLHQTNQPNIERKIRKKRRKKQRIQKERNKNGASIKERKSVEWNEWRSDPLYLLLRGLSRLMERKRANEARKKPNKFRLWVPAGQWWRTTGSWSGVTAFTGSDLRVDRPQSNVRHLKAVVRSSWPRTARCWKVKAFKI